METEPLQSFNADILAARMAKIPVELVSRSLLQAYAPPTKSQLFDPADVVNAASFDPRHQAAIDIYAQLGSMVPVLDGLSVRAIASRQFSSMFRRVLWYLSFVLLVALLGLIFFKVYVAPEYEVVRQDMQLHYNVQEFNGDTFPYIIPTTILIAVLLLLNLVFLLTNKTGFFLRLFGGQKYVRSKVCSSAAQTLAVLASQSPPPSNPTETVATLYSLDSRGRQQLSSSSGKSSSPEAWQTLSQYWALKAAGTFERARTLAPSVLFSTIGGSVAVAYGIIVYGPLIGLLRDLIEHGLRS